MAYAEQFQVNSDVGIHHGQVLSLLHLPERSVFIDGVDATAFSAVEEAEDGGLLGLGLDRPVTIEAHAADPQMERDLVHLAMGGINAGRDLWPQEINAGKRLPPEAINQWANIVRTVPRFGLNLPQEGATPIPPDELEQIMQRYAPRKRPDPAPVIGEMAPVTSRWAVVSLGELQQPGGVGATQEYNPVVDGPNPDAPVSVDNSDNSFEQSVALETWVNYAVDLLNRGEMEEAILAKLAHDGCPDPASVLKRAQEQPMTEKPVSDEIGQDPFEAPPAADSPGTMESLDRQPPVVAAAGPGQVGLYESTDPRGGPPTPTGDPDQMACPSCGSPIYKTDPRCKNCGLQSDDPILGWGANPRLDDPAYGQGGGSPASYAKVRVAGTSMTGVEVERWEGQWGEGTVRIALDEGGTIDVAPSAVEEAETEAPEHPVTQIQSFIDGLEEVKPTRPHIEARIANMQAVRVACNENMYRVGFHDQVRLASIDSDAQDEIRHLREFLGSVGSARDAAYLAAQPRYRQHAVAHPRVARVAGPVSDGMEPYRIRETAAIFVSDLDPAVAADAQATAYAAAHHAAACGGDVPEFVRLAEEHRVVRTEEFAPTEEPEPDTGDHDGPAEAIFL